MRKNILILLTLLLFSGVKFSRAAEDIDTLSRPVIGYYNLEMGGRKILATYLSPFSYTGKAFGASGYWTKMMPWDPERLAMNFDARINYGELLNPAHSARELEFSVSFDWGLEWKKRLPHNLMLGVGGVVGVYGGAVYLPRNGNNPVSARFAMGIGATADLGWHTRIGRLPILVSDRVMLPLLGGFFSPQYGETFYEIYLGNHAGLAHLGWPGNRFGIDNLLSVTLDFGRTSMLLGYRFAMQNQQVNHLVDRTFYNAFVIGVVPGGIGLKKNRKENTPLY